MFKLMLTLAIALFPMLAWAQSAEFRAKQKLEGLVTRLSDPSRHDTLAVDASALMIRLGLQLTVPTKPEIPVPVFVPEPDAIVELVDIRLVLTRIAIQAGAQDHAALIRAQGDREHDVILLRGGLVALTDLVMLTRGTAVEEFILQTPAGVVLTRPLAIWDDAGLSVRAGDVLVMDRVSGSFVANLGWLDIVDGTIRGSAEANPSEPAFRPFILTAGQGNLTAKNAVFTALGFNVSRVFGGLAVVNSGLEKPQAASVITDSTITDVASVAMLGTSRSVLLGNQISKSAGTAVMLWNSTEAVVAGNTFSGVTGKRAIRVTAASQKVELIGNLLSQGPGIGILIDGGSNSVALFGNVVLGSRNSGIVVKAADCIHISGNLIVDNKGDGISLTDTDASTVVQNGILFNKGSGVLLRDQPGSATVLVSGNVITGNRDGLHGATAGRLTLDGNQLDGQLPHIFSGDLAPLTVDWLRRRNDPARRAQAKPLPAPCMLEGGG